MLFNFSPTVRRVAKAVVAAAGFVALVAGQVVDGNVDPVAIYTAGVGLLTTLGVYKVANRTE
jgi:hypothetical protein